jgi:predicted XRE-type DNA-binding protein
MPRVAINKKKYALADFSEWVIGRMNTLGYTQKQMGEIIGIGQSSFSEKLRNNKFTLADVITILQVLKASDNEIVRLMKM